MFVTSTACTDISEADARDCILGYTCGNDLACRLYRIQDYLSLQAVDPAMSYRSAPVGPVLVSPDALAAIGTVILRTRLNGEVVQEVNVTQDMIFNAQKILSFASRGTTIPAGTVFMTGTPSGIGAFKDPRRFLQDGDVVEVDISGIGVLRNRIAVQ